MSIEFTKFIFDVVQTILIALIGIMNWLNNRQRVTTATITKLETSTHSAINDLEADFEKRADVISERLTRVETSLENVPNHEDLGKIYDEMRKLSHQISHVDSAVNRLAGGFEPLERLVNRMDEFWRQRG